MRDVVGAAVDVPVEGASQVRGGRVLLRVEGHPEDLGMLTPPERLHGAELAAERHLVLVVQIEAAEDERAVGVECLERPLGKRVVAQQLVTVDTLDQRAHSRCQLLGRDRCHR